MESALAPAARCPVSKLGPPRATKSGPVTLCGNIRQTGEKHEGGELRLRERASAVGGTQPVTYRYRFSVVSESFFKHRRGQSPTNPWDFRAPPPACCHRARQRRWGCFEAGVNAKTLRLNCQCPWMCDVCAKTQVSIRDVYDESLILIVEIIGFKNATNSASKGTSRFATQGARKGTS
jgi:hypothetical protein